MKVRKQIIAIVLATMLSFSSLQNIQINAANLGITLTQVETGSPDFDVDDSPGNDSSISNNIVRTNDTILYEWDFNVNGGSDDNVTITQTLPPTAKWIFLPPQCGSGSSISTDEQTITCVYDLDSDPGNGNTIPSGTAVQLYPQAIARGTAANGDLITTSASIVGDGSSQVNSSAVTATVSAAPRYDIEKRNANRTFVSATPDHPDGFLSVIPILIKTTNEAKGNELLDPAQPIVVTDTLLGFQDGNTPNSQMELATWETDYCGGFVSLGYGGGQLYPSVGVYPSSQSVTDSGTIACSQPGGPGTSFTITIDNADLSGEHIPTEFRGGAPIPNGDGYLVATTIRVFEPLSTITEGATRLLDNELTAVFPDSISGVTTNDIDTTNNEANHTFENINVSNAQKAARVDGYTQSNTGRDLYATESYTSVIQTRNLWVQDHTGVILCDKFDHTTQNFTGYTTSPGSVTVNVDYGYKNFADYVDMENTTCEDSEPGVTWSSTPQPNTNIIRGKFVDDQAPGSSNWYVLYPEYTVRSRFFEDAYTGGYQAGDLIPNGYKLWDYAAAKKDNFNNGDWVHTGNIMDVDHIFNADIPEIEKTLSPDTGNNQFITGDTVTYSLVPTLLGDPAENQTTTATIVDTLPAYLSYQPGTATLAGVPREPDTVAINGDGTTTLTWVLPDSMIGTELDEILFSVTVSQTTPNFETLRNEVVISTPDTLAPIEERSDEQDIQVIKDAVFAVSKLVNTPQIYPEEQLEFVLEYVNSRSTSIPQADLIDIFPFNGDSRSRPSNFKGSLEFDSVTGTKGGEVFYFTNADPATINSDDGDPSNVINTPGATAGDTIWCLATDFGTDVDCPASNSQITALRSELGSVPNDGVAYNVTLTFNTSGNQKDDIYTNHFEVEPDGLLQTISNEVSSIVIGSELGDYVWNDDNENGIQDEPASSGINGVLATLWNAGADMLIGGGDDTEVVQDASGNLITPQTTSNNSSGNPGYYMFKNLIPSWYYVVFDNIPDSLRVTQQNDLDNNGLGDNTDDSDVTANPSSPQYLHSDVVEIGVNNSNINTDLGLFEPDIDLEITKTVDANQDSSFTSNSNFIESAPLPNVNGRGNSPINYQISLNNANGSINATGVEVTDYIPAGVTITVANVSSGSVSTGLPVTGPANLVWNVGTVNMTDTLTLDLEGYIASSDNAISGQFTNIAEVTAADQTDSDSMPGNIDTPFNYGSREDDETSISFQLPSAIGNFIFEDTNGNGIQDSGEIGIPGVAINLYDAADLVTSISTTTSDSDGSYLFDNLDPNTQYVIEFEHTTTPTGYAPTTQVQGSDNSVDSDGDTATGLTSTINLLGGTSNLDIDQGYIPLLSLGDLIFEDINNNGVLDSGERGIEGVTINLYQDTDNDGVFDGGGGDTLLPFGTGSSLPGTSITDSNGNYLFTDLQAGGYFAVIPARNFNTGGPLEGFTPSSGQNGSILGDYEVAPEANSDLDNDDNGTLNANGDYVSSLITLEYGNEPTNDADTLNTTNTTIDFSLYQMSCLGSLVWEDLNGNGIKDLDEPLFSGVEVILRDSTGTQIATTVSDESGEYEFCYLVEGEYYIEYDSLPPGYRLTSNNQDSQGDPVTFRTPTFTVNYNEQGQTIVQSGVVSGEIQEPLMLIRTGKMGIDKSINIMRLLYSLIIFVGIVALWCKLHALQKRRRKFF